MRHLLCLCIGRQFGRPETEQLDMIKAAGFDGFFMGWRDEKIIRDCAAHAKEIGLYFQSLHAPYVRMKDMWHGDDTAAKTALDELLACLALCEELHIPILVVHAFIGFEDHSPTAAGIQRFGQLVAAAEKTSVRIAFENTEGEEYLDALLQFFKDSPAVGYCWDTGHEMCYSHSRDLLQKYGRQLICTHLNDNLGVRDIDGKITWLDDLHLLPFDGIADWDDIANRLKQHHYQGELTFELNIKSKPNRHDNDKYSAMPLEQYFAECYARACKVAAKMK